jgi:hypothetical protein
VRVGERRGWSYDVGPLGLLVPLLAIRHVHNLGSRGLPLAGSFMELLGGMADQLLEGPSVARSFMARTATATYAAAMAADMWFEHTGERMAAEELLMRLPQLTSDAAMAPADRIVTGSLVSTRGRLWAKIKAPVAGPALFGSAAVIALLEHVARRADYEGVAIPAAAAFERVGSDSLPGL